jgi:hypothetical protein
MINGFILYLLVGAAFTFFIPTHLAEAENLIGLGEKKFQNFLHHHSCLRQKFRLALEKKNSEFSASPHLPEAEILIALRKKKFNFHTTIVV